MSVVVGDSMVVDPLYAGRSGVGVGVDAVRFQLPANLPDASVVALTLRTNGKDSNTVFLPITR